MKLKKVLMCTMASLSIFSTVSHANIMIFSSNSGENLCAEVKGAWTGAGTVTARVMGVKIRCDYSGNVLISGTGNPSVFSADIDLHLTSGLCPPSESLILPGTCDAATGAISLASNEANLSGTLSQGGTQANLSGTVNIPIMGTTVVGTVERMELHKV